MLALKLCLPGARIFNFGTKTCGLALMVKVGAINRLLVGVQGNIAADASPKAHSVNRYYILGLTVNVAHIESELAFLGGSAVAEEACLCATLLALCYGCAIAIDDHVGCYHLIILFCCLGTVNVADVESCENLFFLVESHVLVLLRLECRRHKSKQERNDNYDNDRIYDCVGV